MHVYPYILVKADDSGEATDKVEEFIDELVEQKLIDYGYVIEGETKLLSETIDEVRLAQSDHKAAIEENLKNADKMKETNNRYMRGYYLRKAGELLSEDFSWDANLFNIDSWNYSIPEDSDLNGWYSVAIDYHV